MKNCFAALVLSTARCLFPAQYTVCASVALTFAACWAQHCASVCAKPVCACAALFPVQYTFCASVALTYAACWAQHCDSVCAKPVCASAARVVLKVQSRVT